MAYNNYMPDELYVRAMDDETKPGALGILVEPHSHLLVEKFHVSGQSTPARLTYLYTEALLGAGEKPADWGERLRIYSVASGAVPRETRLILWPEGSIHGSQLALADEFARNRQVPLITGAVAYRSLDGELRPINLARLGGSEKEYVKRRLAPFGEVYPFRRQLASVYKSFGVTSESYITGENPVVFPAGELHVGPLICYESAFPWATRETVLAGADSLAFLTSDQTFDGTPELLQHLGIAQLRCIETRRFGMRAASSGISAVIAPSGRVESRLENGQRGVLSGSVAPRTARTLFVRWGDWFVGVCGAIALSAAGLAWRRTRP